MRKKRWKKIVNYGQVHTTLTVKHFTSYVLYALLCTGATNRNECVQILRLYITQMVKASSFELARMLRQPLAIRFNRCSRLFAVSVKRMRMHLRSREFSTHTKCVSIVGTCQRQIALNGLGMVIA